MNKLLMTVTATLFFIGGAFAEDIPLEWDPYADPASIDGIDVEYCADIMEKRFEVAVSNCWVVVNTTLLPATATTFTDNRGSGWHHWRIVAVKGVSRGPEGEQETFSGTFKFIKLPAPTGARTP